MIERSCREGEHWSISVTKFAGNQGNSYALRTAAGEDLSGPAWQLGPAVGDAPGYYVFRVKPGHAYLSSVWARATPQASRFSVASGLVPVVDIVPGAVNVLPDTIERAGRLVPARFGEDEAREVLASVGGPALAARMATAGRALLGATCEEVDLGVTLFALKSFECTYSNEQPWPGAAPEAPQG